MVAAIRPPLKRARLLEAAWPRLARNLGLVSAAACARRAAARLRPIPRASHQTASSPFAVPAYR